MKKTFPLKVEGKHPDRHLEAIKHEVRKYIRRERRRALPAGVDFWDFDCKFGTEASCAEGVHLSALTGLMDAVARAGGERFYVEVVTRHGHRQPRPPASTPAGTDGVRPTEGPLHATAAHPGAPHAGAA